MSKAMQRPMPLPSISSKGPGLRSKWRHILRGLRGRSQISIPLEALPTHLTDRISIEVYERIMDHLANLHPHTLFICTQVCRLWVPRSRFLLLTSTICHPVCRTEHDGAVLCASPYREHDPTFDLHPVNDYGVLYGTQDGIYRASRDGSGSRLLSLPNVSQIKILMDQNLFLCLSDGNLVAASFSSLRAGVCQNSDTQRMTESDIVSFHVFSTYANSSVRVAAVKASNSGSTSITIYKLVRDRRTCKVVFVRNNEIATEIYSVRFLNRRSAIVAIKRDDATREWFQRLDLNTLNATRLPKSPILLDDWSSKSKPIISFLVDGMLLLCFDDIGIYVDRFNMANVDLVFRWDSTPVAFALHEPYILAFSETRITVWNIQTAEIVQTIHSAYRLLDTSQSGERILVGHENSVAEIVFS
ncbi:CNH domain-containing protein [Roridomyces roridus]|uniref:CNH domain-containing protein n=1 Tax=Roridomyces roridus TaxID=1738132 RepID=A0AAD7BNC0_9AGAR|nr:CNH domain-containing protein [Roridomyces roridus]